MLNENELSQSVYDPQTIFSVENRHYLPLFPNRLFTGRRSIEWICSNIVVTTNVTQKIYFNGRNNSGKEMEAQTNC